MDILNKKDLIELPDDTQVEGFVYICNYGPQPQKNGGQYIAGRLQAVGDIQFKVWSDFSNTSLYSRMMSSKDLEGKICRVSGKVDRFGGNLSLVLKTGTIVDESSGLQITDFMESVYDSDKYMQSLRATLNKYCSPNAVLVFEMFMKECETAFKVEYAAISHHDNCKSGLLAHSTKVTKLATMIKMYPALLERVSVDTLFIGCALHDIGKIVEYQNGTVSSSGQILSHRLFGPFMLYDKQDKVIELMGTEFYYNLMSVLSQHHGEYGERPQTVVAYLVHLLDKLESELATLNTQCSENQGQFRNSDGYRLN